jgi:hypothetical protein
MDPVLLGLLAFALTRKRSGAVNGSSSNQSPPTAFLYQLPSDSFTTTRLAVSAGGDDPKEVGIFGSPDKAVAVAQSNGWTIAHGGQILQLQNKPGV